MNTAYRVGLCSILLLVACSTGAPAPATPETPAAAEDGPPANETERERTIRLAKEKRAQCDTLADTIQGEPDIDVVANINDGATLEGVAVKLDKSVAVLQALSVSDATLTELRKAHVDILRGKAAALRAMAAAADADKKQHLKTFQQHNDEAGNVIERINEACSSAPGMASEAPSHPG